MFHTFYSWYCPISLWKTEISYSMKNEDISKQLTVPWAFHHYCSFWTQISKNSGMAITINVTRTFSQCPFLQDDSENNNFCSWIGEHFSCSSNRKLGITWRHYICRTSRIWTTTVFFCVLYLTSSYHYSFTGWKYLQTFRWMISTTATKFQLWLQLSWVFFAEVRLLSVYLTKVNISKENFYWIVGIFISLSGRK